MDLTTSWYCNSCDGDYEDDHTAADRCCIANPHERELLNARGGVAAWIYWDADYDEAFESEDAYWAFACQEGWGEGARQVTHCADCGEEWDAEDESRCSCEDEACDTLPIGVGGPPQTVGVSRAELDRLLGVSLADAPPRTVKAKARPKPAAPEPTERGPIGVGRTDLERLLGAD